MANCAVVGCSNSYYKLQRWAKSTCPVHNKRQDECVCKEPFQFFSFPSNKTQKDLRLKWIKNVNRKTGNANWQPTTYSRICSDHFVDGTPTLNNPYPTVHMGYNMAETINSRKPPIQRFTVTETPKSKPKTSNQHLEDINHDHQYNFRSKCDCTLDCSCEGCLKKERQICLLKEKILSLEEQLKEEKSCLQPKPIHKVLMESDKNVKRFLGMPSKKLFLTLVKVLTPKAKYLRYWKGRQSLKVMSSRVNKMNTSSKTKPGPARKLTITQELMVVFLKLQLNLTNELIAVIFNISASVCSQIITTYLKFLAHQFKCLIFRPTMEEVKATLPDCFKETVPNARGIIDCTEMFIEKPNSHDVQASTWSDYKHHNTLKCLIDITPTGIIQFISPAWGGRTSDKSVVLESGYLDTVERGDTVLADRGFPIAEELMIRGASLYIPPGARGMEQMTKDNVLKTKKVANLRIHVERAINRMKWFRILSQTLPISMAPLIDDILTVCAIIVNLYPPLVK